MRIRNCIPAAAAAAALLTLHPATAGADDMKIVTPHFGYITNTYENQDQGIDLEDGGLFFH